MSASHSHPTWFTVRFNQPSEWASLHVPEAHITEWLEGAACLFRDTSLWDELIGIEATLAQRIKEQDWSSVSPWHLVLHLKIAQDIKTGMTHFLPPPYSNWPIELRQASFLAYCLIKGHTMIEDDPNEDFGLPELAHISREIRPVFAAVKPLWHCLAEPIVRTTIAYHHSHHPDGVDAALLKLMTELGDNPDNTYWHMLSAETPTAFWKRVVEHRELQLADHHYVSKQSQGNVSSEVFFRLNDRLHTESAASALARALTGDLDDWLTDAARSIQHSQPDFIVTFDDTPTWLTTGGYADAETHTSHERRDQAERRVIQLRQLMDDPKFPVHLRQLVTLIKDDPALSNIQLAKKLGVSSATIGNWKRQFAAEYPDLIG